MVAVIFEATLQPPVHTGDNLYNRALSVCYILNDKNHKFVT